MSATRGSKLSRAIEFFETADLREVRVAFQIVKEVVEGRLNKLAQTPTLPFSKKTRTRKAKPAASATSTSATFGSAGDDAGTPSSQPSMSMREQEKTLADA